MLDAIISATSDQNVEMLQLILIKNLNSLGWNCPVCLARNQNEGINRNEANAPDQCFLRELTNCFKGGKAFSKLPI